MSTFRIPRVLRLSVTGEAKSWDMGDVSDQGIRHHIGMVVDLQPEFLQLDRLPDTPRFVGGRDVEAEMARDHFARAIARHLQSIARVTAELIASEMVGIEPRVSANFKPCACKGTGRVVDTSTAYGVATPVSRRCSCEAGRRMG